MIRVLTVQAQDAGYATSTVNPAVEDIGRPHTYLTVRLYGLNSDLAPYAAAFRAMQERGDFNWTRLLDPAQSYRITELEAEITKLKRQLSKFFPIL